MAGNARFELRSASPEANFSGNYPNGQRGYSTPSLDRSASFRESADSRIFASGKANSRGSATTSGDATTTLLQCLMLEQIAIGDPKYARSGDLRRVLGFSVGNSLEDNPFGVAQLKNSSPGAVEELKRLRASVSDTCVKASARAKKLDDHLNKLNKYCEAVSSKKQQQRNEILTNERSCGSTSKIGTLIHRNTTEFGSKKIEDRPKNGGVNKRLRTSVAETLAECRNSVTQRQPLTVTRERDLNKDNNVDSDIVEGKIRRLPAGGEGWDKKMKRKRSVGSVFSRSIDNEGEIKRTMHQKLPGESSLQSSDSTHSFRPGASGSTNKLDPASSPAGSSARIALKHEQEKSTPSRDLASGPTKERTLGKVNVRMGNRADNNATCPSPILKGKASRAPRSGSMAAAISASKVPSVSVTLESWEQPQSVNKPLTIGGASSRKRSMPSGSSSPPITKWVGQRPQKISRTRRTNLIPVSSHDDVQMQSELCSASDFSPRLSSASNAAVPTKSSASGTPIFKAKSENAPSPSRLSESEESGVAEIRIQEKDLGSGDGEEKDPNTGQNIGPTVIPIKKNKIMVKEDNCDGVRRHSGRMSPFFRSSISPTREKLDNVGSKPQRNARSGSEKNGSKSGRPLKKLSDRKGFSRLGHIANGGSPDCSGESEDDREELSEAANLACYSSLNACTSPFWKTVEVLFACIGADEKSFLIEQLKLAEETCTSSYQNYGNEHNVQMKLDDYGHDDIAATDSLCFGGYRHLKNDTGLKNSLDRMEYVEQLQSCSVLGSSEIENRYGIVTPLYQRVLSAFIIDDEIEISEEIGFGRLRNSINDPRLLVGAKRTHLDLSDPVFGSQTPKTGNAQIIFSCHGNADFDVSPSAQDRVCNGDLLQTDGGYLHSEVEVLVRLSSCDYVLQSLPVDNSGFSSMDCQYEQTCFEEKLVLELQSIGLFVESSAPALDDKEDEVIHKEIVQLENGLHEQTGKKKSFMDNIYQAIQESKNIGRRDPEQIAMDKLVELAFKKLLATRGSFASKHGIPKVSKQVALTFAKRTLSRCRKFEDSRTSCFSDPALQDAIFAMPPRFDEAEMLTCTSLSAANDAFDASTHQSNPYFAKTGPMSNRTKRKEVSLDDVGGGIFRTSPAPGISDTAKGKRSERDRDGNTVVKVGRSSMAGSKGERKVKSKPKQKTAQLSTSTNGFVNKLTGTTNSVPTVFGESGNSSGTKRKDVRFTSSSNVPPTLSMDVKESLEFATLPMSDKDNIDELVVDSESGEPQDLTSWFNFDVDGLHDHDLVGLEIPMDDLAELNMF